MQCRYTGENVNVTNSTWTCFQRYTFESRYVKLSSVLSTQLTAQIQRLAWIFDRISYYTIKAVSSYDADQNMRIRRRGKCAFAVRTVHNDVAHFFVIPVKWGLWGCWCFLSFCLLFNSRVYFLFSSLSVEFLQWNLLNDLYLSIWIKINNILEQSDLVILFCVHMLVSSDWLYNKKWH